MRFINRIKQSLSPYQQAHDGECEHDWEVLEIDKLYRYMYGTNPKQYFRLGENEPEVKGRFYPPACRRVCLLCGECEDQIKEAKDYIESRIKAIEDRKILAKRLWEENCKERNEK